MLKHLYFKTIATVPLVFLTLRNDEKNIIIGLVYIVMLDTVLGIWVGLKQRKFTSNKMARLADKVGKYGIAMASVWIIAVLEPSLRFAFHYMGIFLILGELISNFENLALLGLKLPAKLISKINKTIDI